MAKRIAEYEESILNPKQEEKKSEKQEQIHRNVIASYNKQILAAQDLSKIYDDQATLAYKELQQKMQGTQETKKEKEVQDAVNKVINERDKVIDSINKKIAETDPNVRGAKELLSIYQKQKQEIMLTAEAQAKMTKELVQDTQKAQETFEFGWTQAFNQFRENAQTSADVGRQSFNVVVNSMTSALENFAKTGKLNFADMIRNMIMGIIQLQIQMQAVKASNALFSFMGFSGGSGTPAPVESKSFVPVGTGSAGGGDLSAGQASIVGENGPEIIVPRGASTIIPNHMTSALGGTNQTINNYNIQAIDTKSFEDRIYGSSGAIWAANQYATKNIATTRSRT
jgi:lambda family phage tail tape measure protein